MKPRARTLTGLLIFFLLTGLCLWAGSTVTFASGLRYSISVAKFENKSNWSGQWNLGDAWGAVLTDSLHKTDRFIVLGEKDMRREARGSRILPPAAGPQGVEKRWPRAR